ncbi:MAG: substrate-binding domain-containing protein [Dorea sp.]|nr:substrate-binding domain-containing protein [Dorea sp.]
MKKMYNVIAATVCAAMCVCACSSGRDADGGKEPAKTQEVNKKKEKAYQKKLDMITPSAYDNVMGLDLEKGTTLSVIGKAKDVPYWDEVKKGAEQAVEDMNKNLGYEGKARIKLTYSAPAAADNVDEQVNILDEELARYPEAMAIAIADTKACEVQFDLAAESDIPVVAFDSGSDYQGLMASVSTDNKASAREAAQRLADLMDEKGEVILFVHDSKSESAMDRESSFKEELENNYPEIAVAEVYHLDQLSVMQERIAAERNGIPWQEGSENGTAEPEGSENGTTGPEGGENGAAASEGSESTDVRPEQPEDPEHEEVTADMISEEDVMDYIMEKHPDAAGIYATNGEAVRLALDTVERNERKAHIIGFDGDKDELEALEEGRIDALLLQNPFGMGYAAVIASARAALSMGNEAIVDTGYTWITKKNLKEEHIQKLLY